MEKFSQIKNLLRIEDVVNYYGVNLDRNNRATCPFHDGSNSKTFSIKSKIQKFSCFSCGASGDLIDFVTKIHNVKNIEAINIINRDFKCGLDFNKPINYKAIEDIKRQQKAKQDAKDYRNHVFSVLSDQFQYYRRLGLWTGRIEYWLLSMIDGDPIPEGVSDFVNSINKSFV